ncbi:MAG: aspartate 1-decarboxylase [Bacteroidales bacterium]|nr:aspartate 1-decarboxylase [Bacteroidales bacterium]
MQIEVLKSKIHKVKVTQADLNYIGSITIDENLMDAVDIIENERVHIYNITNGERFDTYVIRGERNSGVIGVNGAAARKVQVNDLLIIVSYARMDFEEARSHQPAIIFPTDENKPA